MSRFLAIASSGVVIALAVSVAPTGCSSQGPSETETTTSTATNTTQTNSPIVGNPCLSPDEKNPAFAGFGITEESLITGPEAGCAEGVCLVNHFQGRVTCPLGQPAAKACTGAGDTSCGAGSSCVAGSSGFVCRTDICQQAASSDGLNVGKSCCVPGTDTPVEGAVCGQCSAQSKRAAADTVYCSCRCATAEGAPAEPDAKLCSCPAGFACTEIRKYTGIGDPSLAGSYCVREGTEYDASGPPTCGTVKGYVDLGMCAGLP